MVADERVVAAVPVRVADVGGWTDTWFGSPGRVCHLAVGPGVRVEAGLVERRPGAGPVALWAIDLGRSYDVGPSPEEGWAHPLPGEHPLLEHAIAAVLEGIDPDELDPALAIDLTVRSAVPAGASLGTSAAVVVAVIRALDALFEVRRAPEEVAVLAHQVETERTGRESGVQDQWAAAMGGCGLLDIGPYPDVRHRAVELTPGTVDHLGDRLVTVVFGAHDSSAVHRQVIDALVGCGGAEHDRARSALRRLSALAGEAADALAVGDVDGWADVLARSTVVQHELHPELVGPAHQRAIEVARAHGAVGWKVNGAGGDGGSLTLVAADHDRAGPLADALADVDPVWTVVDLEPAAGLSVVARGDL
jgi:D-glycero-alpha-D-manno-heptose-7-phosphate kinase